MRVKTFNGQNVTVMRHVLKLVKEKRRPLKKELIAEVTQLVAISGSPVEDSVNELV